MKLPPRFIPIYTLNGNVKPLIVDALASGKGVRYSTQDVIGAGPRTVAGVLEAYGYDTVITTAESFLNSKFTINDFNILLISGMSSDISAIQKSVKRWRKSNSGPVVIGGPATSEPDRILSRTGGDIAVVGEGEYTLRELLNGGLKDGEIPENLAEIRGISYLDSKHTRVNSMRPVLPKAVFREYPPSTKTILNYRLFKSARVYVEVVRGCSNYHRARIGELGERCIYCEKCTESCLEERYECPVGIPPGCGYCSVPSLYGPPKSRPVDLIIDETEHLLDLGVHRVVLSAPGFLDYQREVLVFPEPLTDPRHPEPNYDKVEELLSGLTSLPKVQNGAASIMIENMKAALVTERAACILGRYLKGTPVSIGFETGSDTHSSQLGRPDTPHETLISLKRLKKAGLKPYVYFIHGLPGQNEETVNETIHMIDESINSGTDRVILYRFQSLPASTFSLCPSGPPVSRDILSKRIYDAAQEANIRSKTNLVNSIIKVVIAERYNRDNTFWIAYPMLHGPVMLIKAGHFVEGDVVDARVTGLASERMVYGEEFTY